MRIAPLVLVCALSTVAAADGLYFSESFGGARVHDELGERMPVAGRFRLSIGYRFGAWAIEGSFAGTIGNTSRPAPREAFDTELALLSLGIDVKHLHHVTKHVELYVRASAGEGWLDAGDHSGRSLGFGAGIQYKGKVPAAGLLFWPLFFTNWGPKMTGAVFVDNGFEFYRLHRGGNLRDTRGVIDAQLSHLTFGFAVGADF